MVNYKKTSKNKSMNKIKNAFFGFLTGVVNGMFGSAGGIIAVEFLKKNKIETKKAHATSIAVILSISLFTSVLYYMKGQLDIKTAYQYMIGGFLGAITGCFVLKKMPVDLLRRIFGFVILIGAGRMLMGAV